MRILAAFLLCANAAAALDVPLRVRETAGVDRSAEVVRSGVPIPRSAALLSTANLAILAPNGSAVPAQFRVLARWNAGRNDASAPIQWLLVSFAASVTARATETYRLVDGPNPAPAVAIRHTRDGNRVTVDTGAATFIIDAAAGSLFEEIRYGNVPMIAGGSLTARIDGADTSYGGARRVFIEDAGPLSAVIVVQGTYGAAQTSSERRYTFSAGSPVVIVRQTFAHEGTGALRINRVRDTLRTTLGTPLTVAITGAHDSAIIESGVPASLTQRLRAQRTAPPRYDIETPNGTTSGDHADGALLALRGNGGMIAVALERMHQYEPQALAALADGSIAIDVAAGDAWLGARQALFATFAIGVLPPSADPRRAVWAPLNHPLRAWPSASWFAGSDAVDPFPAGAVAPEHARYDAAVRQALDRTLAKRDELGIRGLMTFGLFPRIWGNPIYADEIACGDDPTPDEDWDDLYWCTTWTDYHNTAYTAAVRAMRSGEVEWLDEITRPAALRVLYTQVFQCSPDDDHFYCGQAPAGYGGYRADFNSSHAYFDNLQLYYWLTGDTAVVETLERGARSMRNYLCTRRPAAACRPHDPPVDEWANLTGRVASQWVSTFRFVGLASDDASYLDDYRNTLARAVTQQYVEAAGFGFLLAGWRPVTTAGRVTTDQLWMSALYDLKNLVAFAATPATRRSAIRRCGRARSSPPGPARSSAMPRRGRGRIRSM